MSHNETDLSNLVHKKMFDQVCEENRVLKGEIQQLRLMMKNNWALKHEQQMVKYLGKEVSDLSDEVSRLKQKLDEFGKSSSDLKAKFIGEHYWMCTHYDLDDDEEYEVRCTVPWTLQKKIFREMCEYVRNRKDEEFRP